MWNWKKTTGSRWTCFGVRVVRTLDHPTVNLDCANVHHMMITMHVHTKQTGRQMNIKTIARRFILGMRHVLILMIIVIIITTEKRLSLSQRWTNCKCMYLLSLIWRFWSCNIDLLTLVYDPYWDIMKMCTCTPKMKSLGPVGLSEVRDRHTNSQSWMHYQPNLCVAKIHLTGKNKIVPYSITSIGHGHDPSFLAVSLQVTLFINPVVGCRYFLPGPAVTLRAKETTPLGRYQILLLGDRGTQV